MSATELSDLQKLELKEAFDEFDKVKLYDHYKKWKTFRVTRYRYSFTHVRILEFISNRMGAELLLQKSYFQYYGL